MVGLLVSHRNTSLNLHYNFPFMISFITWSKLSTPLTRSSYSITEELPVGCERQLAADIRLECALSKDMPSDQGGYISL